LDLPLPLTVLLFCRNTIKVQEFHSQLNREEELLKNNIVDKKLHQQFGVVYGNDSFSSPKNFDY
jgi:hypothetical protein